MVMNEASCPPSADHLWSPYSLYSALLLPLVRSPSSAAGGSGGPAGYVVPTALDCCCLWSEVPPQPLMVQAVLQDMLCRLLCIVVASGQKSLLSR